MGYANIIAMRLVGTFDNKRQAVRFCDFLNGSGLDGQLRRQDHNYEVWVLDDGHMAQARSYYSQFKANPDDTTFQVSQRDREQKERQQARELKARYRQYFQRVGGNQITILLIIACVIIYFLTLTQMRNAIFAHLMINLPRLPASGVWAQQPWRLLTPMFLHFSIIHILFNMFWLYDFGSLIENKQSKWFFVILVVFSSLLSNVLQYVAKGPMFGGMSGVVYGLFAYLWIASKYNLRSGYYMSNQIVVWMLGWFILCFTGLLGPVANYGHLGGLIAGVIVAFICKLIQDRK